MSSPHLERKLKDAVGDDAGAEQAAVNDRIDPLRGDIAELRHEMQAMRADLRAHVSQAKSDLIVWSFVFWVGAVGAIAMLAGVLK